jgi:hypothetical protein
MFFVKLALGFGGTLLLAGMYSFHQGVIRVSVDEHRSGGGHFHLVLPAAAVPMATHFVPDRHLSHAFEEAGPWLPAVRTLAKELRRYPDADFVEVTDASQHVRVRTRDGKLQIDVESPDETVHISCPLATLDDLSSALEARRPGA